MNNYEKIVNSSPEEPVEFFRKGCGRNCPCFDYCHAKTDDDCWQMIRKYFNREVEVPS